MFKNDVRQGLESGGDKNILDFMPINSMADPGFLQRGDQPLWGYDFIRFFQKLHEI